MPRLFWLFLILLVIFRYFFTRPVYKIGDKVRISGTVFNEPVNYGTYQTLTLAGLKIHLPSFPEVHYGDSVIVEGWVATDKRGKPILQNPILIEPTGAKLFHPALSVPAVSGRPAGGINMTPVGFLTSLRQKFISFYEQSLPEPHASLIAGIVLGAKSSLPADFWMALKNTGTMHVVVASGMNVTFVIGFLMSLTLLFFKRKPATFLAMTGVWLYVIISGLQAPIIRAAIMGSLVFLAQGTGRLVSAWRVLVITALGMLIVFPDWLGDLGYLLSFASTTSLMLFQRRVDRLLKFLKLPKLLNDDFTTSLAAQIGVAPILFVTFGQFNPFSPFVNALVLWTIGPIMMVSAVAGAVGLALPGVGRIVAYLTYPLTWWFVGVVRLFG